MSSSDMSSADTLRRLMRSSLANLIQFFVALPLSLILVPVLLEGLGEEGFGVWTMVNTLLALSALLYLGLVQAVIKRVAEHEARGESDRTRAVLDTSTAIFAALVLIVSLAVLWAAPHLAAGLFPTPAGPHPHGVALVRVSILVLFLRFPFVAYANLLTGLQRLEIVQAINLVELIATTVGGILLVNRGAGVLQLVWWLALTSAIARIGFIVAAVRVRPGLRLDPTSPDLGTARDLFGFGLRIYVSGFANHIHHHLDKIVFARLLGRSDLVGLYGVASGLMIKITSIVHYTMSPLMAAGSEIASREDPEGLKDLYRKAQRVGWMIGVLAFGGVIALGEPLVRVWLGGERPYIVTNLRWLAAGAFLYALALPAVHLMNGAGHPRQVMRASLVGGGLNVVFTLVQVLVLESVDLGRATGAAMGLEGLLQLAGAVRVLGVGPRDVAPKEVGGVLVAWVTAAGVAHVLASPASRAHPSGLLAGALAYAGIYAVLLFVTGALTPQQVRRVWHRFWQTRG